MKIAFASQTGNVATFVENLGIDAEEILNGSEEMQEPYVLITYTDGLGDLPDFVEDFLDNSTNVELLRGVVASGNMAWEDTYCLAADVVHERHNVPILGKIEDEGTAEDVDTIREKINNL